MLQWPQRATPAIGKLFENLQDIDVYVEDRNDETFYKNLIQRLVNGEVRIEKVFGLSGRTSVIQKCFNHDQSKRKALFLIDGDLYFTKGLTSGISNPALHELEAYCIENYIFCETAAVRMLMEECDYDEETARTVLGFRKWIGEISKPLSDLFAAYATSHEFAPTHATVASGVGPLCKQEGKHSVLDKAKVERATLAAIKNAKSAINNEKIVDEYFEKIRNRLEIMENTLTGISGKDFLLPLLLYKLGFLGCRVSMKVMRRRLSLNCDLTKFAKLKQGLIDTARSA